MSEESSKVARLVIMGETEFAGFKRDYDLKQVKDNTITACMLKGPPEMNGGSGVLIVTMNCTDGQFNCIGQFSNVEAAEHRRDSLRELLAVSGGLTTPRACPEVAMYVGIIEGSWTEREAQEELAKRQ